MGIFRHSAAALGAVVGAPLFAAGLALRPAWRPGWRERLGAGEVARGGIWLHAASVGEVRAAAPLAERLRAAGHRLTLSTTSATGRALWARLLPEEPQRLAPLDHPWCIDAALRRAQPRALVLVETELWPVWIAACERRGIPVVMVSARISDRSYPRYRRLGSWLARTLARIDAIGARSELDRERFIALGAAPERVHLSGDLKLDPSRADSELAPELARWLGDDALVVGGSTHPGEEAALLEAQRSWEKAGHRAQLLLAPRYPKRASEVSALVRGAGRTPRLRSDAAAPLAPGEVAILDGIGELSAIYARARVAFVGGSLAPGVGGHNLLEPLLAGTPPVYGPHVEGVRHAAQWIEEAGAGWQVANAAELAEALLEALADPGSTRRRAEAGVRALEPHRGSSERALALVEAALERERAAA